ncbi:MAG: diacylglycerol kinase family protein [bacterium]
MHEVVNGLMQLDDPGKTPLGIILGGTGNSVLQHLDCLDPLKAARRIVAGNIQPLDVVGVQAGDEVVHGCRFTVVHREARGGPFQLRLAVSPRTQSVR